MNPIHKRVGGMRARTRLATIWNRVFKHPKLKHPIVAGVIAGVIVAAILCLVTWLSRPSPAPIAELIDREAALAGGAYPHSDKELEDYGKLFASDATMLDCGSGEQWRGRTAIVDRLRTLHFETLNHKSYNISISGLDASAESETTFIMDKPSSKKVYDTELWFFRKINGTWQVIHFAIGIRKESPM